MTGPPTAATEGPPPSPFVAGVAAYTPARPSAPTDLHLDGNEGAEPSQWLLEQLAEAGPGVIRRYPKPGILEAELARCVGVEAEQVVVTAGGDDAIDRICRAVLAPGRELILPVPTFVMFERAARLTGAVTREVSWREGAYPREAVLAAVSEATAMIAVVSPNNPTGAVATPEDLVALSEGAPNALLLVDLAYTEFADEDLTATALGLPNALVVRSLSKAWGLAGLRVGFAAGPKKIVDWMRAAGLPYAVSSPSLALASAWLERGAGEVSSFVDRVRGERALLSDLLSRLGARPRESHANFVLAGFDEPIWVRDALAGLGIGVRAFPTEPLLDGCLRITCPGSAPAMARLSEALETVLEPEALLVDMDGVLVDVSRTYRRAVVETARRFGVELTDDAPREAKARPGTNNDWVLTRDLLAEAGVEVSLEEVTERFEELYQGTPDEPGLCALEELTVSRALLERLRGRARLAVVTGRTREDALRTLDGAGLTELFETMVCMHDAPSKPDPAPLRLAMERLGVRRAWMLGDTVDDITAARRAGVLPVGVLLPGDEAPGSAQALVRAGAARVLSSVKEVEELLP